MRRRESGLPASQEDQTERSENLDRNAITAVRVQSEESSS